MAGTTTGSRTAGLTNKQKYDQLYLDKYGMTYYAYIGSLGGKKGTGHAFAHGKVDPRTAGRKGGYTSRRGSKKNES